MKEKMNKTAVRWLIQRSKGEYGRMMLLVLCNGIFAATGVGFAVVSKGVIDRAIGKDLAGLKYYGLMMCGLVILQLVLRLLNNSLLEYERVSLGVHLRQQILTGLMRKEYRVLSKYHSGELLNRMFSDVQEITDGLTGILPSVVSMGVRLVLAVGVLIAIEPRLTLVLIMGGLLVLAGTGLFRKKVKLLHKQMKEKEGTMRSFFQEAVESLLVIKVFGAEKGIGEKSENLQNDYFQSRMKKRNISIAANAGIQFVFRAGYFGAMLWGAWGIYQGTVTYGSLTAVLQLVSQVQSPFSGLSGIGGQIFGMLASAERLMEMEEFPEEPETPQIDVGEVYKKLDAIVFHEVSFSYERSMVLRQVSFRIEKGDFVAVTGFSGGGKSTLFLLLMGVYVPDEGKMILEMRTKGIEKTGAGRKYRGIFAYVPQGNYLFSGTLYENITMLRQDASQEEIEEAVRTACADEFISQLPDGLFTRVGERGHGFSEGQVQRIAVARALLSRAPVLLLDESTSALDEMTEARMLANIGRLREKTCMIVTHRKAALSVCSKELRLEEGQVTLVQRERKSVNFVI